MHAILHRTTGRDVPLRAKIVNEVAIGAIMPVMRDNAVRAAFAQQAEWCVKLGSPLTAMVCDVLGQDLDRTTAVGERALDWPGIPDSNNDALPLRLTGALHGLVREGKLPELAACYPPHPLPDRDRLRRALRNSLLSRPDELTNWLDRAPQTNEVGRSAALMAGLLTIAARYPDRRFALFEVGASAGLNLLLDRYRFRLGDTEAGDPASPLLLVPEWEGRSPPPDQVTIASRRGVDLHPLDLGLAEHRERLLAYVWPDQAARLAALRTALDLAEQAPPAIDRGDAADWTEQHFGLGEPGVIPVLTHTIAFHYFPAETQTRIANHLARLGATATPEQPIAWLRYEFDRAQGDLPALTLTAWPDGGQETLAVGHPHGRMLKWLA